MRWLTFLIISISLMTAAGEAHAYIGPGLGLGALGVVLGFLLSIVLAILALVWYPAKRLLRRLKPRASANQSSAPSHQRGSDDAE